MNAEELRKLPAVSRLLELPEARALIAQHGHTRVTEALRIALHAARQAIRSGDVAPSPDRLLANAAQHLFVALAPSLVPVINASGVIIHTNLGRAPLSERARHAAARVAAGYCNLEYDLTTGERGSRYVHAARLLKQLTGAEDALVVNNNAAAVLLVLSALARDREVLISRSQLVEIGGGFRIPDVMRQSGARLVEVGTTNRTYVHDYAEALHPANTALILRVHHSNFILSGFVHEPSLQELVALGEEHGIPVVDDLGSGSLLDTQQFGLAHEPTIQESLAAGAALVTASGDKLLGGPQAGLILGKAELIARLRRHPLARALRVDKTTLAALEATLRSYLEGRALEELPVWRMIAAQPETLRRRVQRWQRRLHAWGVKNTTVIPTQATVGGGSLPGQQLPSWALALASPSPDRLARHLRQPPQGRTPVIARIEEGYVLLDARTVLPEQDGELLVTLHLALSDVPPGSGTN
ncbi:MAG: L-seryl-tRNA(Sec) selenium transferase [Anaerolineae bacterium]|nr:L-seryl-tRNA(Sec) selenium transferase [Anaerolineae bacterium]MDW8070621.1 L-seryl-tRNA(Sec) selenium transferase [Anaerolineae bacterium]